MGTNDALTKREFSRQFEGNLQTGVFLVKKWHKVRWQVTVEELPDVDDEKKGDESDEGD